MGRIKAVFSLTQTVHASEIGAPRGVLLWVARRRALFGDVVLTSRAGSRASIARGRGHISLTVSEEEPASELVVADVLSAQLRLDMASVVSIYISRSMANRTA